ncbi:hypothetical protein ALC62_13681 [Cyphomyrmex costatus]|uniref:Uncharacterized protein n=1 Tax=Cyphomyrmex costatus TaxID=456900 RepID=A0A151I9F7_9HYME|nr:hypothetical protein ALC62_13681 [Cyphomyrmex costatus]
MIFILVERFTRRRNDQLTFCNAKRGECFSSLDTIGDSEWYVEVYVII